MQILCKFGCGQEGKFPSGKNGLRCSENAAQCPVIRKRNSDSVKKSGNSIKENNPTYSAYWISRGYSKEEASIEISKRKKNSIHYWTSRGYSEEDALTNSKEYVEKSNRGFVKYWTSRGYSEEDALTNSKEYNNKLSVKLKERTPEQKRSFNNLCAEFWIKRGYSEEEAKLQISKQQNIKLDYKVSAKKSSETRVRNLNKLTKKERSILFRKRHDKLYKEFQKKEHSPIFKQYWMKLGYSDKEAQEKVLIVKFEKRIPPSKTPSSIENKCFDELSKFLDITFDSLRYLIIDGKALLPDRLYKNYVFEFNGTNVHLDNRFYGVNDFNCYGVSFTDKKASDDLKIKNYIN